MSERHLSRETLLDWQPEINEFLHRCELIRARDGAVSDDLMGYLLLSVLNMARSEAFQDAARLIDQRLADTAHDYVSDDARCYMTVVMQDAARSVRQANG